MSGLMSVVAEMNVPLADRLAQAKAKVASLQHRRHELLLDLEEADNVQSAAINAELATISSDLDEARQQVSDLEGMIAVAAERGSAKDAEQARKIRQTQVAACLQHCVYRDRAAIEFEAKLRDLIKAYRTMVESAGKIRDAWPAADGFPQMGMFTNLGEIQGLITEELYRQSSRQIDGKTLTVFPGAKVSDFRNMEQPDKITKLSDKLRDSTNWIRRTLRA